MAWLNTFTLLDMKSSIFKDISSSVSAGLIQDDLQNPNAAPNVPSVQDWFTITTKDTGSTRSTILFGENFSVDLQKNPTQILGNVFGFGENYTTDQKTWLPSYYGGGFKLNLSEFYNVISTSSVADDVALFKKIFDKNDGIASSDKDDVIYAYAGNDYISPGLGNNSVDGGEGIDAVQYYQTYDTATITRQFNGSYLVKTSSQTQDILSNVERIDFMDKSAYLTDTGVVVVNNEGWFGSGLPLDMSTNLLKGLKEGFISGTAEKNVNLNSFFNPGQPIYADAYTVKWADGDFTHSTMFNGKDLSISQSGVVTGVVKGVMDLVTAKNGMVLTGLSFGNLNISFQDLHAAILSSGSGDDTSILSLALSGNNNIKSSASADVLSGFAGNDFINPMQGDDTVDGGAGIDTVSINELFALAKITKSFVGSTIVETEFDGKDTLANVERLQFSDKTIALDINENAGQGYRIYEAAFNRKPDAGGLGYWIAQLDKGATLKSVAEGFLNSSEFQKLYGSSPSNATFVDNLYKNILDRAGEKDGVDFWVGQLNNGVSRADVLVGFSESAENKAGVIGSIQNGIEYKEWLG